MKKCANFTVIFLVAVFLLPGFASAQNQTQPQTQPFETPVIPDFGSGWKLVRVSPMEAMAEFKKFTVVVRLGFIQEYENIADNSQHVLVFNKNLVRNVEQMNVRQKLDGRDFGLGKKQIKFREKEPAIISEVVGVVFTRTGKDLRTGEPMLESVKSFLQTADGEWIFREGVFIRREPLSEPVATNGVANVQAGFVLRLGESYRIIRVNWPDVLSRLQPKGDAK